MEGLARQFAAGFEIPTNAVWAGTSEVKALAWRRVDVTDVA